MGGPDECPVYKVGDLGVRDEPASVGFVGCACFGSSDLSPSNFVDAGVNKLKIYKPDFYMYSDGTVRNTGMVHSFGGGMGMSLPVSQRTVWVWGYRHKQARLGVGWDDNLMVNQITSSLAYDAGLLEGDTLVSFDGIPIPKETEGQLALGCRMLTMQPGEEVKAIWIRPGEGRMSGTIVLATNEREEAPLE
jgi:hypothetical protein